MIEVLVGMIGSGKSTYATDRADAGAHVVCHDDLTKMLHARYRYEAELRDYYRSIEETIAAVAIGAGRDVLVDRTHLTSEARARWVGFARDHSCRVVAVTFPIESAAVHARRRYESDPRGRSHEAWYEVACHHFAQALAEPIGPDEGFDEIREAPGRTGLRELIDDYFSRQE